MGIVATLKDKWNKFEDRYPESAKLIAFTGGIAALGTGMAVVAGGVAMAAGGLLFGTGTAIFTVQGLASICAFSGALIGAMGTAASVGLGGLQLASEAIYNNRKQTDVNETGQTIEGPGWAISKLDRTQQHIDSLTREFCLVAQLPPDVQASVDATIKSAYPAVSAVKVTDAGPTQKTTYTFIRRTDATL